MKRTMAIAGLCVALVACNIFGTASAAKEKKPLIQMAILLDTSGSMDGLIEQAKTQLWKIVNEFATMKKNGERPELEVALYEYGKDSIPAEEGYLRMIVPLTTDLDKVSEELFALTTNGGSEYCGKVIKSATQGLAWSASNDDLKAIFIAGNEPFTQGDVDFREVCPAAIAKGIMVNTIFCGPYDQGVATNWKDGATLADGNYMNIDQNRKSIHIAAPQDTEIARLGIELNKTYIPYGAEGVAGKARQAAQDVNAEAAAPGANVQRAVAKGSGLYKNTSWDLVDAVKEGQVKIEELKDEELSEKMQKMDIEGRKAYVEANFKEREKIQQTLSKLNGERKQFVAEKMKELAQAGTETLDAVMIKTVKEQATKKSFSVE